MKCKFDMCGYRDCGQPSGTHHLCEEHRKKKCGVCGRPSLLSCGTTVMGGSGLCGAYLCGSEECKKEHERNHQQGEHRFHWNVRY
jgi:hypothetical protein